MKYRKVNKIHFVGIGGIGMSGIAELLINLGFEVSGSDINKSEITNSLKLKGAKIFNSHNSNNVNDCDAVVFSSAIDKNNIELEKAKSKNIPIFKRAEMLGELISLKETSIGISGTHGKTSTSSIIGALLSCAKMDPTMVVGGLVKNLNANSKLGDGNIIIVEADEYDKSFLQIKPTIAVITNIEKEHMDCYDGINDLLSSFTQFANSVPFYGSVVACIDSPYVEEILINIKRPISTYGISKKAKIRAENINFSKNQSSYELINQNKSYGYVNLNAPGMHNILNSLAAAAIGFDLNINKEKIIEGIKSYGGVRRRFEIKGVKNDIMIVDDYAHHPSEVKATLEAAITGWKRRLVAVFQPHLYSRTKDFYLEFANELMPADILIITDIYPAREKPIKGVSGKLIYNAVKRNGHTNVYYKPNLNELNSFLNKITNKKDLVITLGAGTIWRYGQNFYNSLKSND